MEVDVVSAVVLVDEEKLGAGPMWLQRSCLAGVAAIDWISFGLGELFVGSALICLILRCGLRK